MGTFPTDFSLPFGTKQLRTRYNTMANNRVNSVIRKFMDSSMQDGTIKQRKKFETLSKSDKRSWREALQRAIANVRNRIVRRALCFKPRGKTKQKFERISKLEMALLDDLRETNAVSYQAGGSSVASKIALVGGAVSVLAGGAYIASKYHKRVCNSLNGTASDVADSVKNVKNITDDISGLLNGFKARFEEFIESVRKVGGWLFRFVVTLVGAWFVQRYTDAPALVAVVTALVVSVVPEAVEFLKTRVVSQSGFGIPQTIALLCTLVVPSLSRDNARIAADFMRLVTFLPKFSDGLENFIDTSMKMVEQFVNFVLKRDSSNWLTFSKKRDLIEKWRHQCIEVCSKYDMVAKPERELIHSLQKLIQEGYGFMQVMSHPDTKRELQKWLDCLNKRLAPHLGSLSAENNMRVMPYCAILGGGSGVGKTSAVQVYAAMVLLLSGEVKADEVLQNLWQKGITEYWNGYLGQRALIKDDCFQVRGVAGAQDSEAMEFIRAIGNWACPLNFADVESKGRYYLDVAMIVGTTNAMNIKADWEPYITCPEALVRRFQGAYWLEVNKKYATPEGRYDFERISAIYSERLAALCGRLEAEADFTPKEDDILDLFPWEAWTVRQHTFDNSSPGNAPIFEGGLRQAVKDAAAAIRMRRESHKQTVANITKHMELAEEYLSKVSFQAGVGEITEYPFVEEIEVCDEQQEYDFRVLPKEEAVVPPWMKQLDMAQEYQIEHWYIEASKSVRNWVSDFYTNFGCKGTVLGMLTDTAVVATTIATGVALVGYAAKALWAMVKSILKFFGMTGSVVSQSNNPPAKVKDGLKKFQFPRVNLQVGVPPREDVHKAIYKNMYSVSLVTGDDVDPMGNIVSLGQTVFIMPAHFDDYVRNKSSTKTRIRVMKCLDCSVRVDISVKEWFNFRRTDFESGIDLRGITFGRYVGLNSNRVIVGYFLKEADISNVLRGTNSAVRLDIGRVDKDTCVVSKVTMMSTTSEYVSNVVANGTDVLQSLIKYHMPTMGGDCGAPLTLSENRYYGGSCILGLHVAGQTSMFHREGYATVTTQEAMREVWLSLREGTGDVCENQQIEALIKQVPEAEFATLQAGLKASGIIGGSISYLGPAVDPAIIATKSCIKRSPMHSDEPFGPCPTAPAILHPVVKDGGVVYPMAKAVEAYQSPLLAHDPEELDMAVDVAMQKHWQLTKDFPRDILTFEESIVPPEGWKLKPLNRKSSAGYKYRNVIPNVLKYPGKTFFFGFEGDVDFSRPSLQIVRKDVANIVANAVKGVRVSHVCMDFLKDELRSLEKVDNVKTRMISGTELDYSIAIRQYFGAFQAAMYATCVRNGMSPGVNHYTEWHMLAEGLLSKGGSVFDGDFSRFDASEQPWVHEAILKYINKWYAAGANWKPEDDQVRNVLWLDLINSVHLTGESSKLEHFVQWHKSLPSGHPLTTLVNSMYSLITMTACYMRLTGDVVDMWNHVFINTYGDDNVVAVDTTVRDQFNQVTVAGCMDEIFGLTYTAGAKDGTLVPYTTIDKITYLQRGFLADDDEEGGLITNKPNVGWVAPLNFKSFMFTPYFFRNNKDPMADMTSNCEKFVCELSLHTKDVWDEYFPKLDSWCSKNNVILPVRNRAAARTYIKTRFDVWY